MKLGLLSAILGALSFEEVVDFVAEQGLSCVEAACWPTGGAERRYAGTCHIDAEHLTAEKAEELKRYCRACGICAIFGDEWEERETGNRCVARLRLNNRILWDG